MGFLFVNNLITVYIALFGIFAGLILTVIGSILNHRRKVRRTSGNKPASKAWAVVLTIGILVLALSAFYIFMSFNMAVEAR